MSNGKTRARAEEIASLEASCGHKTCILNRLDKIEAIINTACREALEETESVFVKELEFGRNRYHYSRFSKGILTRVLAKILALKGRYADVKEGK